MSELVSIPVGRGKVVLHRSLQSVASAGSYIVIDSASKPGPCNDDICQPIRYADIHASQTTKDFHRLFIGEGYMLAIDPVVFEAIDRNRETVTLKKSATGRISAKGLAF